MFWGLSESLNLYQLLITNNINLNDSRVINILIINGCDARHILKTLAEEYANENVKFRFYLMEFDNDLIGRQILLMNLALDFKNLGPFQKTRIFMELYGNSVIRSTTNKYLNLLSNQLILDINDLNRHKNPYFDLKYLLHKDIDYLTTLFKFWTDSSVFNITKLWNNRIRNHLGKRYDSRIAIYDWDLIMTLYDRGAKTILKQEYSHWRDTGVAFTWIDCEFNKGNLSLASRITNFGNMQVHCGYRGDITTGPFLSFGSNTDNAKLLRKTATGQNYYRATDIFEYNLKKYFYQLQHKKSYESERQELDNETDQSFPGLLHTNLPQTHFIDNEKNDNFSKPGELTGITRTTFKKLEQVENSNFDIIFIRYPILELKRLTELREYFHLVYLPYFFLDKFSTDLLRDILRPSSLIVIETERFNINLKMENLKEHSNKINAKFENSISFRALKFDYQKDTYANFIYNEK